ncbi:DUF1934 domain-containing protein [Caldisalinibacter kiritimatiensis]|uniref:DUF1934 domain-containing protein n=1 Tax=Caldisalinibacter kiritimatiensis TaxID=1304284 RepID=R1CYM2_9FIRM|nr:DUF1934 domain-containing protein [Caldisalinibacter kiritimatiensis]EOD01679.1 DUF1934 domain-containing protein [Caldisalinibacter kiritimatiensis]
MKEVKLKIVGKQINEDGEENVIELVTEGKFYKKNDSIYLVYDESEISGMDGSTTTLKIQDDKVMMKRFGSNNSKLIFEKGKKHKTGYQTPYGILDLEVITNKLNVDIVDGGKGSLSLSYRLNISNTMETKNELDIDIN